MGEDTWPFFGCCLYCVSADGRLVVDLGDWSIYFSEWFFTFSPTRSSSEHVFSFLSYDFPQFSHGIQDGISCNNTISPEYYTYKYTSTTLWEIHTFMVSIQGKTSWGEIKQNISKYLLFWRWDHMHVINSKCNPQVAFWVSWNWCIQDSCWSQLGPCAYGSCYQCEQMTQTPENDFSFTHCRQSIPIVSRLLKWQRSNPIPFVHSAVTASHSCPEAAGAWYHLRQR